jgi:PAS domain S-box-containing protein
VARTAAANPVSTLAPMTPAEAEAILYGLASVFQQTPERSAGPEIPNLEPMYRTLVEQIPAVVFMAYLDRGIGEAYVSPRIEEALGFSRAEWLEDPIRWYNQIHPDDQQRWSIEAAEMFSAGKPLRSAYRVLARDGRVIWFHCEAKIIAHPDGRPWLIHGIGFDISDLKLAEQALAEERNLLSALLDTVGALVLVLSEDGRILRFNRECEMLSGYASEDVRGQSFAHLFLVPQDAARFRAVLRQLRAGRAVGAYESDWRTRGGGCRRVAWSTTLLPAHGGIPAYVIASGNDITERKRMERAILDVSAREQTQIGQDLHDGLGQHLTGIAFMSKVLEQKLAGAGLPEAGDARKIVELVNQAIHRTRELARGLIPVVSGADGLTTALDRWAREVEDLFGITTRFECPEPVRIGDLGVATHLYHIAQEAVNNAVKHARATHLVLSLSRSEDVGILTVEDDGNGLPAASAAGPGLGLHIMGYRASMIGGSLEIRRGADGGTLVSCRFPLRP